MFSFRDWLRRWVQGAPDAELIQQLVLAQREMVVAQRELALAQRNIAELMTIESRKVTREAKEEESEPFLLTTVKDAVNGLAGNLLTAAVLYLIAVGGKLVTPSRTITITAASIFGVAVLSTISSGVFWAFGVFNNNYTHSVSGKKLFLIAFSVLLLVALAGFLYLVYQAIQLNVA